MGTVKYSGPVASFHCPTNAEIRSLKVHFSPKQLGEGDPSPENVREIVGWDACKAYKCGKNIGKIKGYSATSLQTNNSARQLTNNYGTTLSTVDYNLPDTSLVITQSQVPDTGTKSSYKNGYICVILDDLIFDETYKISFKITNIVSNPLNAVLSNLKGMSPYGTQITPQIINDNVVCFTVPFKAGIRDNYKAFELRICGMSFTISEFMVTTVDIDDRTFEPYQGSTTNYEFGVLGKNKFNKDTVTNNQWIRAGNLSEENPLGAIKENASGYTLSSYISVYSNTTYTIKYNVSSLATAAGMVFFSEQNSNSAISGISLYYQTYINSSTTREYYTFTTPDNCHYLRISTPPNASDVQLELGSTATSYEPYDPNKTVYGGWVDLISGEVQEEYTLLDKPWSDWGNKTTFQDGTELRYVNFGTPVKGNGVSNFKTSLCNVAKYSYSNENSTTHYYIVSPSYNCRVYLPIGTDENTQIRVLGELVTPVSYHLSHTQLQTFLGQNNIWSNADYVEVEYDLHETQDILARKQFIVANQPHIVKPAAAPLQNFVTDVAAPLKECKIGFKPVQDLHGYSNPWPAGGGKNIAKPYDNNYVSSTYISFDYSAANGTFRCYGTASASSTHSSPSATNAINNGATFTLPAGTYTLSIIDGDGVNIYAQCVSSDETVLAETTSYTTFTTNESLTVFVRLKVAAAATVDNTVKIQLEAGSTATSYIPYENICPISGWNGINVLRSGKNLLNTNECYLANMSQSNGVFTNTAIDTRSSVNFTLREQNGINANQSTRECFYIVSTTGKFVQNFTINNDDTTYLLLKHNGATRDLRMLFKWTAGTGSFRFMADIDSANPTIVGGFTLHNIQITKLDDNNDYEPYNGETIPITFPATVNLFNEQWEQGNIEVGNNAGSSTSMRTDFINVNPSTSYYLYTPRESGVFVFEYLEDGTYADKVNGVHISHTFTTGSTTKKIRIVDRNSGTETVNTGVNCPATITYYEPYGTIYGGYVDLVTGEVWKTHEKINLPVTAKLGTWDSATGKGAYWYTSGIQTLEAENDGVICNRCKVRSAVSTSDTTSVITWYTNGIIRWIDIGTMEMTVAEYRDYLAENPLQVTYKLNTPILIATFTTTQLCTLRGTNNIWSNSNSNIELAYWSH